MTVTTKYQTIPCRILIRDLKGSRIDTLLSRAYSPVIFTYNGKRTISTTSKPVPVRIYFNPDKEKESIVNENKGRTGIYRWVHIESGKSYVGSAKNLSIRFKQYFNYNHLTYPKRNMIIYKALLKYGYAGFRLEILEYCAVEVLIKKEQFYFETFNPEYNMLKVAGSPLGYRHSEASKKLISIALKNIKVSESSRELKRKALLGKTFDKVRIEKMRLSNTLRKPVLVTNTETGEVQEFASIIDAGYYLRISKTTVRKYLLNNLTYNKYTISAKGPSLADKEISDESNPSKGGKISQQPVLVTNQKTGDKKEFSSMSEAAKYLGVSNGRLWYFFNKTVKTGNETLKGYTISKLSYNLNEINRKTKNIEVTDIETNKVTRYPSISLAGKALDIPRTSISLYISKKRSNPFRKKYIFKLV